MNEEVKKPVPIIHIDTRGLTLVQRKAFNLLLWNYYRTGRNQEKYELETAIVSTYLGYRHNKYILKSLKRLSKIDIDYNILDGKTKREGFCNLLGGAEIINDKILSYSFPPELKRIINDQTIYSFLKLKITSLFHSKYSLSLYENVFRFVNVETTGWIEIETFKKLVGVKEDIKLYKDFYEFKRRIIQPAVEEINQVSDITIAPEYKRKGRFVAYVRFSIAKKKNPILPKPLQNQLPHVDDIVPKNSREGAISLAEFKRKQSEGTKV